MERQSRIETRNILMILVKYRIMGLGHMDIPFCRPLDVRGRGFVLGGRLPADLKRIQGGHYGTV
ncbi:MAG: hypothetical protein JSV01_10410 [Desulfobacterales bacterium]|nr:MAG: hypothetical protein JSV01_10410 [Desulfobacterales bacterium]